MGEYCETVGRNSSDPKVPDPEVPAQQFGGV